MGLGIELSGKSSKHVRRADLETWLRDHCGGSLLRSDRRGERQSLWVSLHPAAEDLEIHQQEGGRFAVKARTSTAGPGYHIYVCDVLSEFAKAFAIRWDTATDDTSYFNTGQREGVYAAMRRWLFQTLDVCVKDTRYQQGSRFQIAMPMGYSYTYDGFAGTYLGPRSQEWVQSVLAGESQASEFFPWWDPQQDAAYSTRRALCHMWTSVRWRKPLTGDEAVTLEHVDGLLTRAYHADLGYPIPWREWAEVRSYLGRIDELTSTILSQAMSVDENKPLVGYRRSGVRVLVADGWSIEVPGSFAETWDEDDRWSAWDEDRSVWLTAFSTSGGEVPATLSGIFGRASHAATETFTHESNGILGQAHTSETHEQGKPLLRLDGVSVSDRRFAVITITSRNFSDRDWALNTWRSIENAG